jgi:hypothetical protein
MEASFTSGVILSTIGVVAINKVHTPAQTAFASVPLVFGIQQFAEGTVWLALSHPDYAHLQQWGTYAFLFIARVLWPVLMPLAVLMMEKDDRRIRILRVMLGMGAVVGLYYIYCLLFLSVTPQIMDHHIQYISDFPRSTADIVFLIYVIAAIPPLFISSMKRTRLLGLLMLLSCIITGIFYVEYLTSVWCFFAALVSVVVLWIVKEKPSTMDNEQ